MSTTPQTRAITIYVHGSNHFDVHEGERYHDHLCWDEMLGQIASLTHPPIAEPRYPMLTAQGWTERDAARQARSAARRQRQDEELAEATPTVASALQLLVRWHGVRAFPSDELLPADQQPADVRLAMEALARTTALSTTPET